MTTPLRKRSGFYGFAPMQYSPIANCAVYFVSLLGCSNFYEQDFLVQRPGQSFKEPQSVTPVALLRFQALADSYGTDDRRVCLKSKSIPLASRRRELDQAKFILYLQDYLLPTSL